MPNTGVDLNEMTPVPRRELTVFYVLDTSGSMIGNPISKVNHAMEETIAELKNVAKGNADALLKIAVLEFNSGSKWMQEKGAEELEDFVWMPLSAGGLTDVGSALKELDDKMSRNKFLNSMTGAYLPIVIFMTDGYATDNYQSALNQIRHNRWFNRATKIGFAIGDEADTKMLSEIVGNSEAVIQTSDLDLFVRLIKFASVTSSMLASSSHTPDTAVEGKDIVKQALKDEGLSEAEQAEVLPDEKVEVDIPDDDEDADDPWNDEGWK